MRIVGIAGMPGPGYVVRSKFGVCTGKIVVQVESPHEIASKHYLREVRADGE